MLQTMSEPFENHLREQSSGPTAPELRALYHRDSESARRAATRRGLWVAVLVYVLFSIADVLFIPDVAPLTIAARISIGFGTLALVEVLYRCRVRADPLDLTCGIALLAAYLGWLVPAVTTVHIDTISYYLVFGAIFMLSANLFFSFRFEYSLIVSGLMLAATLTVLFTMFAAKPTYQMAFGIFYISCFTFTSYVNWKLNRERYNVFLNALEARNQHREATERGKALLRLSRTDPLTGLENRRAIDERLREHWSAWQQQARSFAVLLIDVDFFKRFNDFYGHQEGDRCLTLVAEALARTAETHGASIGRYGGEEFIILAPLDTAAQAAELAEEVREVVETLAVTHQHRRDGVHIVTVSVGAAFTHEQGGAKLEKIVHEADRALYLAKASGRNSAKLFDPNDPQGSDESENIAALLRIAIERNLVSLAYQPIQNVRTGRVEGLEALMRLKMLDGVAIAPSLFIPVAERTGAIMDLGRWAIRTACRQLLTHDDIRIISVNVSPMQLKTPGFATSVAAILGEMGVAGDRLAFEITEGLEMEMRSDILRCIADLKLLGIEIWLDDFGTGFAGLSWLRLIDFDTVKIDRSFLHDCASPRGRAMFQDIVSLVRNRGPKILVEGVESEEQMALMRELRIDQVQGFHVGRPVHMESFRPAPALQSRQLVLGSPG